MATFVDRNLGIVFPAIQIMTTVRTQVYCVAFSFDTPQRGPLITDLATHLSGPFPIVQVEVCSRSLTMLAMSMCETRRNLASLHRGKLFSMSVTVFGEQVGIRQVR